MSPLNRERGGWQSRDLIARNTMMLYLRLLLVAGVSLFTSRVVIEALGVDDFGVYSAVGGVVSLSLVLSTSLSSSIRRFIAFELGRAEGGQLERLRATLSTSIIIQILISIALILIVESVGVWFLEHRLVIPPDRVVAARWVLQLSLGVLVVNLVSLPFQSLIIAHEKMSAFAYIGVIDAGWRLLVAYLIMQSEGDRLILYSALLLLGSILVRSAYWLYSRRHFEEARGFGFRLDRDLFSQMMSFSGWSSIGSISAILRDQGGTILLNMFGGAVVSASRGISMQVRDATTQLSQNFMTALNPQIIKAHASGSEEGRGYMMSLIEQGSRLSFYLLFVISLPILLDTKYIVSLWLGVVPSHVVIFIQLGLVLTLVASLSNTLVTSSDATGRIKRYQLVVGGIQALNLPISYLLLRGGCVLESVSLVMIGIESCALVARLCMLRGMIGLDVVGFLRRVLLNVVVVSMVAIPLPYYLSTRMGESIVELVIVSAVAVVSSLLSIYFVGCSREERREARRMLRRLVFGR